MCDTAWCFPKSRAGLSEASLTQGWSRTAQGHPACHKLQALQVNTCACKQIGWRAREERADDREKIKPQYIRSMNKCRRYASMPHTTVVPPPRCTRPILSTNTKLSPASTLVLGACVKNLRAPGLCERILTAV